MELQEIFNLRLMNETCKGTIVAIDKEDGYYELKDWLVGTKVRIIHMDMLYPNDFVSVDVIFQEDIPTPKGVAGFKKGDKASFSKVHIEFKFKRKPLTDLGKQP